MPPRSRASAADKIAAVKRILDSPLQFEQKLSGIAAVLVIATAESTKRSARRAAWNRHDDHVGRRPTLEPDPDSPHRMESEQ